MISHFSSWIFSFYLWKIHNFFFARQCTIRSYYILLCAKSNSKGLLGLFWFLFWNRLHQQGRGSIRVMIIIIGTPGEKNREVDISNKMAGEKLFSLLPSKCVYNFFYGNHTKLNWNNGLLLLFFLQNINLPLIKWLKQYECSSCLEGTEASESEPFSEAPWRSCPPKRELWPLPPFIGFLAGNLKMFVSCYVFNILKQKINKEALVIVVWTKQSVTFEKRVAWKIHLVCDGLDFYTWWASSSHNFHSTQDTLF